MCVLALGLQKSTVVFLSSFVGARPSCKACVCACMRRCSICIAVLLQPFGHRLDQEGSASVE